METSLDKKLDLIAKAVNAVGDLLITVENRIKRAEHRISNADDAMKDLQLRVTQTENSLTIALERLEDQENRSRRCNIRVIGLPEGTEGNRPTVFFERWLPELLGIETKHGRVKINRAHRSLIQQPREGEAHSSYHTAA